MKRTLTLLLASLVTLAACGGGDGDTKPSGDDGDDVEVKDVSDSIAGLDPRRMVRDGFRRLIAANSGTFETRVEAYPFRIEDVGRYTVDPAAFEMTREISSPDGSFVATFRAADREVWVHLALPAGSAAESWPCWVSLADLPVEAALPVGADPSITAGVPAVLAAASYAIGEEVVTPEYVKGTTDLVSALSMVNSHAVTSSEVDPAGTVTTPAEFWVEDRVLTRFATSVALPDGLWGEKERYSAEDDFGGMGATITTSFAEIRTPVDIELPPRDVRLTLPGGDSFDAAMAACGRQ